MLATKRRVRGRDLKAKKDEIAKHRRERDGNRNYSLYLSRLSMYSLPPVDEVSLEEFEECAVVRLRLLKCIETAKIRWPKRGDEYANAIKVAIRDNLPLDGVGERDELFDQRRKDHVSHFILRLAYCKSEELRRWFLTHECELFRYRFEQERAKQEFLQLNGMEYTPIDDATKEVRKRQLAAVEPKLNEEAVMQIPYFQVPFEEAIELVRSRRVYLEKGTAFVPMKEILTIVVGAFRAKLSAALTATCKALPSLEEDSRLLPMLSTLSTQYLGSDYGNGAGVKKGSEVNAADIPQLAAESFPLCMRSGYSHLKEHHHVKYGARQQLTLFLKGIGLSLEQAMLFWKQEFSRSVGADKFEKLYAYNIRHNYGKEGKRADYTPYSCMKIIMSNAPSAGDAHGCPFRHFDPDNLKLKMMAYKVPNHGISDIIHMVKNKHYQLACIKYFEVTHNVSSAGMSLEHPNQYFERSRELRGSDEEGTDEDKAKTKAITATASSSTSSPINTTTTTTTTPSTATNDDEDDDDDALFAAMEM